MTKKYVSNILEMASSLQVNGDNRRPAGAPRHPTAPSILTMNGHFAGTGENPDFEHGVQIIDEDKNFNENLGQ